MVTYFCISKLYYEVWKLFKNQELYPFGFVYGLILLVPKKLNQRNLCPGKSTFVNERCVLCEICSVCNCNDYAIHEQNGKY